MDLQLIVKHISNGTIGENLCRICLLPLPDLYENIFTKVCREGEENCVADILNELCDIQISVNDHYNVCSTCFISAWNAYKFYLNSKRSDEILHFYTDNLLLSLDVLKLPNQVNNESIFITVPITSPDLPTLESDPHKVCVKKDVVIVKSDNLKDTDDKKVTSEKSKKQNMETIKSTVTEISKKPFTEITTKPQTDISKKPITETSTNPKDSEENEDDDLVIIMNEKGQPSFFKMQPNGQLVEVKYDDHCRRAYNVLSEKLQKRRVHKKKREPLPWLKCSQCPIVYRFIAKLREHMWLHHGIMLYSCGVCKTTMEDEADYEFHMKTHTNEYQCDICNHVFRKREIFISHIMEHNKVGISEKNMVCKTCGKIAKDEDSLKKHLEVHDLKEYTCYYCGRMYKKEIGFNNHIRKHERHMTIKANENRSEEKQSEEKRSKEKFTCEVCGRVILSKRALEWHTRLHTNERPFKCKVCGRGFISLNRCNQHELCAHSAPARRCPLCPALFHMRSMVNSHIKKVHLKAHKRRSHAFRKQDVHWPTTTVPIQELSVSIQEDILELQAQQQAGSDDEMILE